MYPALMAMEYVARNAGGMPIVRGGVTPVWASADTFCSLRVSGVSTGCEILTLGAK